MRPLCGPVQFTNAFQHHRNLHVSLVEIEDVRPQCSMASIAVRPVGHGKKHLSASDAALYALRVRRSRAIKAQVTGV